MDGNPADVAVPQLDLAGMQTRLDLDTDRL
jgi:hypothetical protein